MIIAAGEALIDLVPQRDSKATLPALEPKLGGGPFNTARALARLGADTTFCSRISQDHFGEALLHALHTDGVDTSLVQRGEEPTTLAVAHIDSGGSASYSFYTEGTADRLFQLPPALPDTTRAICFGTCSLVLEPGATAYERLLRAAHAQGVFTALDPNIRTGLIADPAAYRARFLTWLPYVRLLKLSAEDAAWLADGAPVHSALKEWLAAGPQAVVLTRGADGLTVLTAQGEEHSVPAVGVDVVDTIGAGDTVNAALLHRLGELRALTRPATGAEWQDVLTYAARAAAVTCGRAGAQPPYAHELVSP
ncbi:carbohydrate kinase [Streptomyces sp. TRM66268-LWL]|uniref:Carbohydrate kinase n=1 Tax=Streptomyces polyasparticus TaxID=2767826 RepID=A0ABR7SES8_9ACTN|nr:carbohydrate kinase [Streptomyces polyasparticus]MBC9714006.1 carbohydrate kinase [Streptomyces polyasparticus]